MKTVLSRLKTLIENEKVEGGTLSYVKHVEIVHPEIALTTLSVANVPMVLLTPVSTREEWVASGQKDSINVVEAHIVLLYRQRETSIMGDALRPGGQGKGIIDIVEDLLSIVRGHRLSTDGSPYLSKPLDIGGVDYVREEWTDDGHLLVATITMECIFQFDQTTDPGNV